MRTRLTAAGGHHDSPIGRRALAGRPIELEGVTYVVAGAPASASASDVDVPERRAGESDSAYAARMVAEIQARRANDGASTGKPPAAPSAPEAAPATYDMGDRVCELMRARREGRAPAAWAHAAPPAPQPAHASADMFALRPGESQNDFARRLIGMWPSQRRAGR